MSLFAMIFLFIYFALFAAFSAGLLFFRQKSQVSSVILGGGIAILFYGLMGLGIAQASTMSICQAEGIIHGQQAATACRANLRIYQARQVIDNCRTKVMEAEHKVFGETHFSKVKLPKGCVPSTMMSTRLAGVDYAPLPAQIKLAPYSKVLNVQQPVSLTRYHGGSTVKHY